MGEPEDPAANRGADGRALQAPGRVLELGAPRLFGHECGYLPRRPAITEARFFAEISRPAYSALLRSGYRRFGDMFFRPRCVGCSQCISYRVIVPGFVPGRRFRRVWKRNADVHVDVRPAAPEEDAVALANAFHHHRGRTKGWPVTRYDVESYARQFTDGPVTTLAARYYRGDELLGIGLFDDLPDGQSAVIFHYGEAWAKDSPGTFNVLWLLERARARHMPYVYLGYWVPASRSTAYKADFRPGEYLGAGGCWTRLAPDHPSDSPP